MILNQAASGTVLYRNTPKKVSIGSVLDASGGVGRGFDTLRVLLSVTILCWHSIIISHGLPRALTVLSDPVVNGAVVSLLPIFFALSGFLVMGSAMRTMSLPIFLTSRVLRIVPALITELSLSAILLGGMVTTLSAASYYTSAGFFKYFGSLIGKIQYSLPGVFTTNPLSNVVNNSLWTLAPEILCYAYIAFVMATGLLSRRTLLSLFVVIATVAAFAGDNFVFPARVLGDAARPHTLVVAFALGNFLFLWRHSIPFNRSLFVICMLAGVALASQPSLTTAATPFLAYVTVYLGLLPLPRLPILDRGDFSYGIYLYAMPVQQSFAYAFPQLRQWYFNIAFALPVTIMLAMISWYIIEKPALRLRKKLGGQAAARRGKHLVRSSPWVIATIPTYAVWLSSTQYEIPLITIHRMWVFAATMLLLSGAIASSRVSRTAALADHAP